MIRDKKVIVTGGLGLIGSRLVEALCRDNDVTVIDDSSTGNIACGRSITINPIYLEPGPGDIKHSLADLSRTRSYNYEPKGDLMKELNETIRSFVSCKN